MLKHWKYLKYVLRHKWFVFLYCIEMDVPFLRAAMHDMSKLLPCEWFPYVHFFYGDGGTRESKGAYSADAVQDRNFEYAWNHHQKHNDHHWQHWIRAGDDGTTLVLPMKYSAIIEMVADWRGAGRALGKPNTRAWYEANKRKMTLDDGTRYIVETLLNTYCASPDGAQSRKD